MDGQRGAGTGSLCRADCSSPRMLACWPNAALEHKIELLGFPDFIISVRVFDVILPA